MAYNAYGFSQTAFQIQLFFNHSNQIPIVMQNNPFFEIQRIFYTFRLFCLLSRLSPLENQSIEFVVQG